MLAYFAVINSVIEFNDWQYENVQQLRFELGFFPQLSNV